MPNQSLEWTSTGWPHSAQQLIIASCGQPVASPQLQRYGAKMNAVAFNDLMDDGAAIDVIADVRFLPTGEGGKSRPISSTYRPNHNFGAPEDRHFYIGQLEIASGNEIVPGETRRVKIRFLSGPGLKQMLTPVAVKQVVA